MYSMRKGQRYADKSKERAVKGNLDGIGTLESKNLSRKLCITKMGE